MSHTLTTLRAIISAYERETKTWENRAESIIKRYRDERGTADSQVRRYNVLWSNVETLKPFLYSATPKPVVTQRGDDTDPIARVASEVLERALIFNIAEDHFGTSLRNSRDDYLLPGRGTVWARYVPEWKQAGVSVSEVDSNGDAELGTTTNAPSSNPDSDELGDTLEVEVGFESVVTDYVHWKDFGHELARTWEEVDVVWRRVGMNRTALRNRFKDVGDKIPLDMKIEQATGKLTEDKPDRAVIYECWIKSEKRAVWLSKSYGELLDDLDDPLGLDHFFPCPRPAYATLTTDSLIPVPDFVEYQDQAHELDDLTGRIALITKSIKAVGVYDASVPALEQILNDGHDNKLIPVKNWAALTEKGGLSGAVELLPMKELAETLLALYKARDEVKADLYEVSGMSDIIRGNTAPEETATAQQIKSNFATKRLEERQREIERFARNIIDIMGNIIALHFSRETLAKMTGIKLLTADLKQAIQRGQQLGQLLQKYQHNPNVAGMVQRQIATVTQQVQASLQLLNMRPEDVQEAMGKPTWEEVMALLRDQPRRRFAIDIETDSIVAPDDQQQQQMRTQFIAGITQFLETAGQIAGADPTATPMLGQLLLFGARGFRAGRDLMDTIENYIDLKTKQAEQPQPPKPDPQMAKVQADAQAKQQQMQMDAQGEQQRLQSEAQLEQMRMQADTQKHAAQLQQETQLATLKAHLDQQAEAQKSALEAHMAQQQAAMEAMLERWKAELQARTQIEVAEISAGATLDAAQISAANQGESDA